VDLYIGSGSDPIRGDFIRRAILRTDLVPIPLTLELDVRIDADGAARFAVGKSIFTGAGDELEIIKAEHVRANRNVGQEIAQMMRVTAICKPVAKAVFVQAKAIIKQDCALSEVYRACGATVKSIDGDFRVPRYTCLSGEAPTFGIARACQEAGGVVAWKSGKLRFRQLSALFEQRPVTDIQRTASQEVASEFTLRHDIPSFYSIDEDGNVIGGDRTKERTQRFQPHADAGALRRMTGVLVLSRVALLKYDAKLAAGDLATVDGGAEDPVVALTVATLFESGADGGEAKQYTRAWLGRLVQ
jgi:hypothetical protein